MYCTKKTDTPDDGMRVEIVDKEEPMAIEKDIEYENQEADTYATIEESNMMKSNESAGNAYDGEVKVTPYNNPDLQTAEKLYHGNVDVKTYDEVTLTESKTETEAVTDTGTITWV